MIKRLLHDIYRVCTEKTRTDSLINVMVLILLFMGLLFSTSGSMNTATTPRTTLLSFVKQILFTVAGLVGYRAFSVLYNLDNIKKNIDNYFIGIIVLLIAAIVSCRIFGALNGNYSWIWFPFGLSLQPSEFAKIIVVLLFACYFGDRRFKNATSWIHCVKIPFVMFLVIVGIIIFGQKDTGSGVICFLLGCLIFLIPDNKKLKGLQTTFVILACLGVGAVAYCMLTDSGQAFISGISTTFGARFRAVRNPSYSDDGTREIFYSLLGISKGSILGSGLGNSVQKFGYLVSSEADYVFPVIVEETGLIGITFTFGTYAILIAELLRYSKLMKNESERIILTGTACYLFLHFFLNIGGVSGFIPLTGVPLLFLSRGGSSLVAIMIMLGIAQGVISKFEKERRKQSIKTII